MVNVQILVGHLGEDAELRFLQNGDAVCNFRVATSTRWKDKQSGEAKENTTWHRCQLWGKHGEALHKYLLKGQLVYVSGETRHRKYTDKDNIERYSTEVRVDQCRLLGGKKQAAEATKAPDTTAPAAAIDPADDDIPFS